LGWQYVVNTFTILHVEDDPNDVFLVQRALSTLPCEVSVQVAENGLQAMDYLAGRGAYSDRTQFPLPQVMLLDLKIPLLDGFEVLARVRERAPRRRLRVFVLSSSDDPGDRKRAKQLGADEYFVKTFSFDDVVKRVDKVMRNGSAKV
jgi:DNA-binding response OmpR family regulator